jgi:hypothetical protein
VALRLGPSPESAGRRIRIFKKMEALLVLSMSMAVVAQGGGSLLGLSGVDYPVRAGDPPNPRLRGEGAAARRRNVLVVVLGIGVQKDLFVISFFCSGLFCKNHG